MNIVRQNSKTIKTLAKSLLKGKWVKSVVSCAIMSLLVSFTVNIPTILKLPESPLTIYGPLVFDILVFGALYVGKAKYFLQLTRSLPCSLSDFFVGFKFYGKALFLGVFIYCIYYFTRLSLLISILMMVALLKYGLAFFILVDNPEKSVSQCLLESNYLMRGNKMALFKLALSFLALLIITSIPSAIVAGYAMSGVGEIDITSVEAVASYAAEAYKRVVPYYLLSQSFAAIPEVYFLSSVALFYDIIIGNLSFERSAEAYSPDNYNNV